MRNKDGAALGPIVMKTADVTHCETTVLDRQTPVKSHRGCIINSTKRLENHKENKEAR